MLEWFNPSCPYVKASHTQGSLVDTAARNERTGLINSGAKGKQGHGESPTGGTLVNYVDAAIADVAAGRPVATPQTEAYGCSVKYQM